MGWLTEEFERAKKRSAQVPAWAMPVRVGEERKVMAKSKITIIYTDGAVETIERCSRIDIQRGVLVFRVEDTAYTSHSEGHPLEHIQSYRVEAQ